MFNFKGPACQSCGMPLSKDKNGGGTNGDGTISTLYCSNCFEDGLFTDPDITLDEMMIKVKDHLKVMFIPKFLASYFTKDIPKLMRWQMKKEE